MNLFFDVNTGQLHGDPSKKYLELGGGDNPVLQPNVDVRPGPNVAFVVDFEKPFTEEHGQAISSDEFDGVFSRWAFEHVGWRIVPQLLREVCRVLRPGGDLVLVLPDTEAQMRHLLETQDWADAGSMLFGGQDYGENAHKSFWNPASATKLLEEAGFENVTTAPFGAKKTDMVVHARKSEQAEPAPTHFGMGRLGTLQFLAHEFASHDALFDEVMKVTGLQSRDEAMLVTVPRPMERGAPQGYYEVDPENVRKVKALRPEVYGLAQPAADGTSVSPGPMSEVYQAPPYIDPAVKAQIRAERARMFDRRYFDGPGPLGGYVGYRDYPCHALTAWRVLQERPRNVLELGCARGYVVKLINDAGVPAYGVDISRHCMLTRACQEVTCADVTEPHIWSRLHAPVPGDVDLCFSIGLLDHIPEALLDDLFAFMRENTARGLHGVNVNPDQGGDLTRCTIKPLSWWRERLPKGHTVVDKDELEAGQYPRSFFEGDGKLKLNLCSYTTMHHHGWVNCDLVDLGQWAQSQGYLFKKVDVRTGLPFGTGAVDLIVQMHGLEHLTYDEGFEFLRECRRVIKPKGVMRIGVPDCGLLTDMYTGEHEYIQGKLADFDELSGTCATSPSSARKLYELLVEGHKALYDWEALQDQLTRAGWRSVPSGFRQTALLGDEFKEAQQQIIRETIDMLPDITLYVEAVPLEDF